MNWFMERRFHLSWYHALVLIVALEIDSILMSMLFIVVACLAGAYIEDRIET